MDRWLSGMLAGVLLTAGFTKLMPFWQWSCYAILVVLCLMLPRQLEQRRYSVTPLLRSVTLVLGGLFCGICWGAGNAYLTLLQKLDERPWQQNTQVVLQIDSLAQIHSGHIDYWRFRGEIIRLAEAPARGRVELSWYQPKGQSVPKLGELWQFKAKLKPPQGLRNEGGFSYHRALLRQGVVAIGTVRHGERLAGAWSLRQWLFDQLADSKENLRLPGILLALSLGERQWLEPDQREVLQRTGLAHLIAISGLHLTLVGGFASLIASLLLRQLGYQQRAQKEQGSPLVAALWLGWLVAFAYAWLADFAVATVRALLMWLVVVVHRSLGVKVTPSRLLLRAVVAVILVDPLAFLDGGFWLSVSAVLAILFMHWRWPWRLPASHTVPYWQRYWQRWWRPVYALWRLECLLALALLPLSMLLFQGISTVAPLVNVVVVPLFTFWVMPLTLLGLALALLNLPAGQLILWQAAEWPLVKIWPVLVWLTEQPWHWLSRTIDVIPYLFLALVLLFTLPLAWRWRLFASVIAIISLASYRWLAASQLRDQLLVHVVDIGQGSALVLERDGKALLVDTGMQFSNGQVIAERTLRPLIYERQLTPELGFITHTDSDHSGGYAAVQEWFPTLEWRGALTDQPCIAGLHGQWQGVSWQVLHPQLVTANASNNDSCVLLFQFRAFRLLVTGDVERLAEATLIGHQREHLAADVLLIPHHGSNTSSTLPFLLAVKPSLALYSRGRFNRYGFPHPAVLERYQRLGIYTADTAEGGQLQVITDGKYWHLQQPMAAENGAWYDADN